MTNGRDSGGVREAVVDPFEYITQSIAETALSKAHEPRPLALPAQTTKVNKRKTNQFGGVSLRNDAALCDDLVRRTLA